MNPMRGFDAESQEPTAPTIKEMPSLSPRCMALVQGTGPHLSDEIHDVLRRRLRIACTISTVGFATF